MSKKLRTVALLKNNMGEYEVFYTSDIKEVEEFELKYHWTNNYRLVSCLVTTDLTLALKARLKFRIMELKSLKPEIDYFGYEEVLIKQIGLLTARLLMRGVDVTDEIALQCYDIRQRNMTTI